MTLPYRAMNRTRRALLGALLFLGLALPVLAQTSTPACPPGNLLARARISDTLDVAGTLQAVVDDSVLARNAFWNGSRGIRFLTYAGSVTYDLGASMPITAAFLQASSANNYSLQVSNDGTAFREIWKVPGARDSVLSGMGSRSITFEGIHARFVRFGESTGPGGRCVSELQVLCEIPPEWPPATHVIAAGKVQPRGWQFTRRSTYPIKMTLAFLGALVLWWGYDSKRRGRPERHRRLRGALLIILGIAGYTGYYNWGAYHFTGRIHYHEFFHYYMGAKYFKEVGYTGLYECACLAEAEDGFRRRVEMREIRDLRRNELVPARYVFEDPERYKRGFVRPFTPERWEAFKKDAAFFRSRGGIEIWERMLNDHGYNASPVWNIAGSLLANLAPASESFINLLGWIDPILVLLAFGFVIWAFGWRVACIAALFFGTNEPALYTWTGGCYLRQDWFLSMVAGICLLRRAKPLLGGASLALSALLRIFPIAFLAGVGLRLLWLLYRERRIDPIGARIVAGAVLAVVILLPLSNVVAGSARAWPEFVRNARKHTETPLTNNMGLRTVVSFRWETRQKFTYDPSLNDPFHQYKEARRAAFRSPFGWPVVVAMTAFYLFLLLRIARREMDWWVLATFGFGLIPFAFELTCYYYSFLTVAAFLWGKRPEIPIVLLILSGLGHVIVYGTFFFDVRYLVESLTVLAFAAWAAWLYGKTAGQNGEAPMIQGSRPVASQA